VLYFLFILFQGNGKMSDSVSSTNDHGQIFVDPQPQAPTLPLVVSGETSIEPVPTSTEPLAPAVPPTFGDGTGQPESTSGGKRSPSHMVRFWFLTVDLVLLSFSNF